MIRPRSQTLTRSSSKRTVSLEADIRALQVEVEYLKRDYTLLMAFRDQTKELIAERLGTAKKTEARGARAVRMITLIGGTLGILSTIGVIIGASV